MYLSLALLYLCVHLAPKRESPVSQMVKSLPAMQETQDQPLGQEDPLEEGMEIHSSILAWGIHGQRSLVGYSPWDHTESDTTKQLTHTHIHTYIQKGKSIVQPSRLPSL